MQGTTSLKATLSAREFMQRYGLAISFLLLCAILTLLSDRFLTPGNVVNVLRQSTINGIIAVGMTFVILTAGIDLSVGALLALSSVVTADLMQKGMAVPMAMLVGLLSHVDAQFERYRCRYVFNGSNRPLRMLLMGAGFKPQPGTDELVLDSDRLVDMALPDWVHLEYQLAGA